MENLKSKIRNLKSGSVVSLLLTVLLCLPPSMAAARGKEDKVVVIVKSDDLKVYEPFIRIFSENSILSVEVVSMKGDIDRGREIVSDLKKRSPALIVTLGGRASFLCTRDIDDIPILFAMVVNWEKYNLRDKVNVTGIHIDVSTEMLFAQFKIFIRGISNLGIIYSRRWSEAVILKAAAKGEDFRIKLISEEVEKNNEVKGKFRKIRSKIDALWLIGDPVVVTQENTFYLVDETEKRNIPFLVYSEEIVKQGALLSISPDIDSMGSQAASTANSIIKGNLLPSGIEVQRPVGTTTTLNVGVAESIGLRIEPEVLNMADKIVGN